MRISYVTDPDAVNSNYRAYQPMQALARNGHAFDFNRRGQPQFSAQTLNADVVHVHRYIGREALAAVRDLQARGIGVVWDNDDDVTNIPRSNPKYALYGGSKSAGVVRSLHEMLRTADVVTTPSQHLAAQFRDAGASDVRVIENHLPDAFPGTSAAKHAGVAIVWLAALEHQVDAQQLRIGEMLMRLLDAHPDLRVHSIGLRLGLKSDRYSHTRIIDFFDIPRTLAAFDIGIAPLADIPWNQAKSNIKLKEYAAAGLPWLASPVGPYLPMGEAQGGLLVPDDGWHEALDRLIGDARARKKLAKRAAKWAKGETISKHVGEWEAAYRDAAAAGQARCGAS